MKGTLWKPADIELLIKLVGDRLSAAQISKEFGGKYSRRAVIGKVHRLKIALYNKPGTHGLASKPRVPKVKPLPVPPPVQQPMLGAAGEMLESGCRYIHGDIMDGGHMCGQTVTHKRFQYCAYHASLCLVAPKIPTRQLEKMANNYR